MKEEDINLDLNVDKKFLIMFFKNPFLKRNNDEIGEKALVNWIVENYYKTFNEKISTQKVLGYFSLMAFENIIIRKSYGTRVLVLPTRNYFLIKIGKQPVKKNKPQIEKSTEDVLDQKNKIQKKPIELSPDQPSCERNSYEEYLIHRIASLPIREREKVKYFPPLYSLACNILNDEYTDWHTKMMISTALGYYILEEDINPDDKDDGYVDDLFIISYVLREIKKHVSSNIITNNWEYEDDVMEIIDAAFTNTHKILGNKACDVLHLVGLWKFKRLELEEFHGSSNEKIDKLVKEKRELLALVAYLVKIIYHAEVSAKSLNYIKNYLKTFGDYDEINRLILLARQGYSIKQDESNKAIINADELEDRLQDSLLKTLLAD